MTPNYKNAWINLRETMRRLYADEDITSDEHKAAIFATLMVMQSIEFDNDIYEEEEN